MKHNVQVLIIFLLFFIQIDSSQDVRTLKLGTATKGGGYYTLGTSIQKFLKTNNIGIEVFETSGSVENIERLKKGEIDLAIVQNDIAFFAENGLYPFGEETSKLRGIITFYHEPIYIITNNPSIISIKQLINTKCNVGVVGSGLYTDAQIIFNSLNLWDFIDKKSLKVNDALDNLLTNQISSTFTNNIPAEFLDKIAEKKLFVIQFSENEIEALQKTYPYFSKIGSHILGQEITTISVKSLLICSQELSDSMVFAITQSLYNNYKNLDFPGEINEPSEKTQIISAMPLYNWHSGSMSFYKYHGIIQTENVFKYWWLLFLLPIIIIVLLVSIQITIYFQTRLNIQLLKIDSRILKIHKTLFSQVVRYKYFVIISLMIILLIINVFLVQYYEHSWAVKHNGISIFDKRTFFQNLMWMLVYTGGGFVGESFPQNPISQFIVTLIPLMNLSGLFSIIGMLTSDSIKNYILETKGLRPKMFKNHIIICGWNNSVPHLIKNLLHEDRTSIRPIVVLANIEEEMPLKKYDFDKDLVAYVKGDATHKDDLLMANIKDADIAVIVLDDKITNPDEHNLLKTLKIESLCKEKDINSYRNNQGRKPIYTILELADASNRELIKDTLADEVISLGNLKSDILVHIICTPGVSKIVDELFKYGDFNEFYSIKVERNFLCGMDFDELLFELRKYKDKILLLAINIEAHRTSEELSKIMQENNLHRSVITNPNQVESKYKTVEGDILIVLAENGEVINNFKKTYQQDSVLIL